MAHFGIVHCLCTLTLRLELNLMCFTPPYRLEGKLDVSDKAERVRKLQAEPDDLLDTDGLPTLQELPIGWARRKRARDEGPCGAPVASSEQVAA